MFSQSTVERGVCVLPRQLQTSGPDCINIWSFSPLIHNHFIHNRCDALLNHQSKIHSDELFLFHEICVQCLFRMQFKT